jgi:hypothetical protein
VLQSDGCALVALSWQPGNAVPFALPTAFGFADCFVTAMNALVCDGMWISEE